MIFRNWTNCFAAARLMVFPLENLTEEEARKIEPRVKNTRARHFSPTTTSADPQRVIEEMTQDANREGITIRTGAALFARRKGRWL